MTDDLDTGATPDIEDSEVPEISLEDSIRNNLRDISEKHNEEVVPDEAPKEEVESAAKVARDEKGKFAKTEAPKIEEGLIKEVEPAPVEDTPLPNTWKKEAAEAWAKADPVLRREVARREADIHKGIEQYRQAAEYAYDIDSTMTPYMKTIESLGITPQVAIKAMLDVDHKLRYSAPHEKAVHLAQLAKTYGIDLNEVVNASNSVDPRVYELAQQNEQLRYQFEQQKQRVEMQAEQELNSQIASFASDPNHAHFETVKLHMAALLQAGQAKDLSDAYEQAIYANPTTRAAVLQQQTQAAKEEAAKRAQAAKQAAGVNLRSRAALPPKEVVGSMQDTIRDTLRRLQNS